MKEFAGLERLPKISEYPVLKKGEDENIDCEICAKTPEEIYESPDEKLKVDYDQIKDIPLFELVEMQKALGEIGNSRCADKSNVVVEMIKYSDNFFQSILLNYFNEILTTGKVPQNGHVTIFPMLPTNGDLENPSNWRPVAILPILYKIFAKMLYYRLIPIVDQYQPDDQFGFRRDKRIEDIFAILENIIGKTDEWNLPVWMISMDLRKAFDTIKFPLFTALRKQGVPEAYVQLLAVLYEN